MTPAQWYRYGGCPTCEAKPARPCTTRRWGIGDDLEAPHPARPLYASTEDISRLLDDVVTLAVREGVAVHPGDTLVVRIDPEYAQSLGPNDFEKLAGDLEAMRAHIQARLPRGANVVIIAADGQLGVVRAEEEKAVPPSGTTGPAAGGQHSVVGLDPGPIPGHTPETAAPADPCCPEFGRTGYAHTEICPAVQGLIGPGDL